MYQSDLSPKLDNKLLIIKYFAYIFYWYWILNTFETLVSLLIALIYDQSCCISSNLGFNISRKH